MENAIVEACVLCGRAVPSFCSFIPVCADGTAEGEEVLRSGDFFFFVGETVSLIMRYSVYRFIYF